MTTTTAATPAAPIFRAMPKYKSCEPELIPCPVCHGTGRNPEAPAELVDDDGTCLVCCFPLHPLYAAHHGHVRPIS